jgi:hypothetical protein
MTTAIIAVVGSLVGVVLGSTLSFLTQYALANRTRKWQLEDTKRKSYAEFLMSISASYARAKAHEGDPEEADLLRATSAIELIADEEISNRARSLQIGVTEVHGRIRKGDSAAEKELPALDHARGELIRLFKFDLDTPLNGESGKVAARAGAIGRPSTA